MKLESLHCSEKDQQQEQTNKTKKIIKKKMFYKHRPDVTMPTQTTPAHWMYLSHNLLEHSSASHFLILDLNVDKDVSSVKSLFHVINH